MGGEGRLWRMGREAMAHLGLPRGKAPPWSGRREAGASAGLSTGEFLDTRTHVGPFPYPLYPLG